MQLTTQHFVAVAGGVTREIFLATCLATSVARQVSRKIASCNMALTVHTLHLTGVLQDEKDAKFWILREMFLHTDPTQIFTLHQTE